MKRQGTVAHSKSRTLITIPESLRRADHIKPRIVGVASLEPNKKPNQSKSRSKQKKQKGGKSKGLKLKSKSKSKVKQRKKNPKPNTKTEPSQEKSHLMKTIEPKPCLNHHLSQDEQSKLSKKGKVKPTGRKIKKIKNVWNSNQDKKKQNESQVVSKTQTRFSQLIKKINGSSSKKPNQRITTVNPSSKKEFTTPTSSNIKFTNQPSQQMKSIKSAQINAVNPFSYQQPTMIDNELKCPQMIHKKRNKYAIPLAQILHQTPIKQHKSLSFPNSTSKRKSILQILSEDSLTLDVRYFQRHPKISPGFRVSLVDALTSYASQAMLRRDTLYMAIENLDRLTSIWDDQVDRQLYRLIGITSLVVASKLEQAPASIKNIGELCGVSSQTIVNMQVRMVQKFNFSLRVKSLNNYLDTFTARWDCFVNSDSYRATSLVKNHPNLALKPIYFREPNGFSYMLMQQLVQIADAAIHRIETFKLSRRLVAGGLVYLLLRVNIQSKDPELSNVQKMFGKKSTQIFIDKLGFNQLFSQFLIEMCGLQLCDIIPSIKYGATMFDLPIELRFPEAKSRGLVRQNYEQFLGYQVHNPSTKAYVLNKFYCQE